MKRQTRANRNSNVSGQHSFAQIPSAQIPRSVFNRSCGLKTTFDAGYLIPIFADEALPGDTMNLKTSTFARMATPLHPLLDNLHLDLFYFSVPLRLVWDNFQKFMGEQTDPGDSTEFEVPQIINTDGVLTGSVADYLGIPIGGFPISYSALWHRAYNLIYKEWFRDENLQDSPTINTDDGPDIEGSYPLRKRGKRHDYFTSCLPWPQKGDEVLLPVGGAAPLYGEMNTRGVDDETPIFADQGGHTGSLTFVDRSLGAIEVRADWADDGDVLEWEHTRLQTDLNNPAPPHADSAYADLSAATGNSINAIRQAFQLQKLYERDARGGTRYTEIVRSHFGVTSPDARLQRPEYLGGGSSPIVMHPIAQTSETGDSPQANLAAYATSSSSGRGFVKSFTEHCVIIGLACVRADLNYQQGIPKQFLRTSRFDYYWPSFAHLGEQTVIEKEIYMDGTSDDNLIFGYQERYAEYRYKPSTITGKMRSGASGSLDTWHLAQDFDSHPLLNDDFIQEAPPIDRVVAVPSEPEFLFDAYFQYKCVRPMPTYSVPGLIDHF